MVAGKSNSAPGRKLDRSKYVGVSMKEYGEHDFIWQVTINQEGKVRHLGYFDDEVEAARTYDQYARVHRKPVNFPDPVAVPPEVCAVKREQKRDAIAMYEAPEKPAPSRFVGVYWQSKKRKWQAQVPMMMEGYPQAWVEPTTDSPSSARKSQPRCE